MTQCLACGGPTKSRLEKHYYYAESGLPNVVLQDAVTVTTCARCGETYISIPAIEALHRQIAAAVIRKKGRLAPTEIRFLRKWLGWSGADFARRMGTAPETVSRWENGKVAMGAQADRLLRLLVARERPVAEYPVDVLAQVAADDRPSTPVRVELDRGPGGWTFRGGPALVAGPVSTPASPPPAPGGLDSLAFRLSDDEGSRMLRLIPLERATWKVFPGSGAYGRERKEEVKNGA